MELVASVCPWGEPSVGGRPLSMEGRFQVGEAHCSWNGWSPLSVEGTLRLQGGALFLGRDLGVGGSLLPMDLVEPQSVGGALCPRGGRFVRGDNL